MADPLGSVEKIVKLALSIQQAVDTVRRNTKECKEITRRVVRVGAILYRLKEKTEVMEDPATGASLAVLEETLTRAHELVTACQRKNIVCHFCSAGGLSRQLREVKQDISDQIMESLFVTSSMMTIMLTSIHYNDHTVEPPRIKKGEGGLGISLGNHSTNNGTKRGKIKQRLRLRPKVVKIRTAKSGEKSMVKGGTSDQTFDDYRELKESRASLTLSESRSSIRSAASPTIGRKEFSMSELKAATNAFSDKNIIGRGGSATVYKGVMMDGMVVVAIKRVNDPAQFFRGARLERFLKITNMCRHKNIVRLLGHCHHRRGSSFMGDLLFVEEYMPNGSLDKIIYGSKLNWYTCLQIIQEIADGLRYLHDLHVIHTDLKLENILLDKDMNPKIGDFGLSRFVPRNDKFLDVKNFEGTPAYLAPEYVIGGRLTTKNDVYSFGLVVLEIICGMSESKPVRGRATITWAREALERKDYIKSQAPEYADATKKCMRTAMLCVSDSPADRPPMRDVVQMLKMARVHVH